MVTPSKKVHKIKKQCLDNQILKYLKTILVNNCHNEVPYFQQNTDSIWVLRLNDYLMLSLLDLPTNFTFKNFRIVFALGGQHISITHQPYTSMHINKIVFIINEIAFTNNRAKQNLGRVFVVTRLASTTVTRSKTSKSSNNNIHAILRH